MNKSLKNNNSGILKSIVAEYCMQIRIEDIVHQVRKDLKEMLLKARLYNIDTDIQVTTSTTYNGGTRFWFLCCLCSKRVGVLYQHPISNTLGCRICLNLQYKSQRYKGMIEDEY